MPRRSRQPSKRPAAASKSSKAGSRNGDVPHSSFDRTINRPPAKRPAGCRAGDRSAGGWRQAGRRQAPVIGRWNVVQCDLRSAAPSSRGTVPVRVLTGRRARRNGGRMDGNGAACSTAKCCRLRTGIGGQAAVTTGMSRVFRTDYGRAWQAAGCRVLQLAAGSVEVSKCRNHRMAPAIQPDGTCGGFHPGAPHLA